MFVLANWEYCPDTLQKFSLENVATNINRICQCEHEDVGKMTISLHPMGIILEIQYSKSSKMASLIKILKMNEQQNKNLKSERLCYFLCNFTQRLRIAVIISICSSGLPTCITVLFRKMLMHLFKCCHIKVNMISHSYDVDLCR